MGDHALQTAPNEQCHPEADDYHRGDNQGESIESLRDRRQVRADVDRAQPFLVFFHLLVDVEVIVVEVAAFAA